MPISLLDSRKGSLKKKNKLLSEVRAPQNKVLFGVFFILLFWPCSRVLLSFNSSIWQYYCPLQQRLPKERLDVVCFYKLIVPRDLLLGGDSQDLLPRWWFQICLFSPLFGEDSHFD